MPSDYGESTDVIASKLTPTEDRIPTVGVSLLAMTMYESLQIQLTLWG